MRGILTPWPTTGNVLDFFFRGFLPVLESHDLHCLHIPLQSIPIQQVSFPVSLPQEPPPSTPTHTIISIPRLHSVRVAPQPAARIPAVIDSWETPHHHSSTSVMFRLLLSPPPLFFFWWSLSCHGGRGPPQGRFHPSAQETKAPQFNTNERWCVCARACGIFMYKAAALRNCQRQIEDKV